MKRMKLIRYRKPSIKRLSGYSSLKRQARRSVELAKYKAGRSQVV